MAKIVVFDLDETLGYFIEFSIFWDALNAYIIEKQLVIELDHTMFVKILDLYPEFIRPNILSLLTYLKYKKQTNACDAVIIYTNNQGPKSWAENIQYYFETKLNYRLFNQNIGAFKVNGKRVELCRTSHEKTIYDLLKCSKLPKSTEICFFDDVFFPGMKGKNVYYIKINPYVHNISFEEMTQRFIESNIFSILSYDKELKYFKDFILSFMNQYGFIYIEKSKEEYDVDKIVTKQAMIHLQSFFKHKWRESEVNKKTRKSTHHKRNKTYRKI